MPSQARHQMIALACVLVSASLLAFSWTSLTTNPHQGEGRYDTHLAEISLFDKSEADYPPELEVWHGEQQLAWQYGESYGGNYALTVSRPQTLLLKVNEQFPRRALLDIALLPLPIAPGRHEQTVSGQGALEVEALVRLHSRASSYSRAGRLERRVQSHLNDVDRARELVKSCFAESRALGRMREPELVDYFTFPTPTFLYLELYCAGVNTDSRGATPRLLRVQARFQGRQVILGDEIESCVYTRPDGVPLPEAAWAVRESYGPENSQLAKRLGEAFR